MTITITVLYDDEKLSNAIDSMESELLYWHAFQNSNSQTGLLIFWKVHNNDVCKQESIWTSWAIAFSHT